MTTKTIAAIALLLAGCQGTTVTDAPNARATRKVTLVNDSGGPLWLCRAIRDGWGESTALGGGASIELQLTPGRYAVQLGANGPRVPLPLPTAELGFEPSTSIAQRIEEWPRPNDDWCWIPAGFALRGDDLGVGQEDERPLTTPPTEGFWLAARETTNAQYAAFLNDCVLPVNELLDLDGRKCRIRLSETRGYVTDAPQLPVVTVSWAGAVAYCEWLTTKTGIPHRLPTETEWEKAARGPGSRVYAFGDTCRATLANLESGRLREVAQFDANGFGLFDMTGNAFEWCSDTYARHAYQSDSTVPGTGTTYSPPADNAYRVLRGGSFVLDGIFCRNSMRMRLRPDVRADDVGFRVLRERTPEFLRQLRRAMDG